MPHFKLVTLDRQPIGEFELDHGWSQGLIIHRSDEATLRVVECIAAADVEDIDTLVVDVLIAPEPRLTRR